jgi:hypothetical protein
LWLKPILSHFSIIPYSSFVSTLFTNDELPHGFSLWINNKRCIEMGFNPFNKKGKYVIGFSQNEQ